MVFSSSVCVQVVVVDSVADYMATLKEVFDFPMLRSFVTRSDFSMVFDALHAVTGAYAGPIFVDELGAEPSSIRRAVLTGLPGGPTVNTCLAAVQYWHYRSAVYLHRGSLICFPPWCSIYCSRFTPGCAKIASPIASLIASGC